MKIEATCTWGEGPDVFIEINSSAHEGWPVTGANVRLDSATFGITANEARKLAAQLLVAATRADDLEQGYFETIREDVRPAPTPEEVQ